MSGLCIINYWWRAFVVTLHIHALWGVNERTKLKLRQNEVVFSVASEKRVRCGRRSWEIDSSANYDCWDVKDIL